MVVNDILKWNKGLAILKEKFKVLLEKNGEKHIKKIAIIRINWTD